MSIAMRLAFGILALIVGIGIAMAWWKLHKTSEGVIKVGILHSLTGFMAPSEKEIADITLLAIEEINESGGLLGKKIAPVMADGKSNWSTFEKEAERLIKEEGVVAIFGGWTSASRKHIKTVVEKYNSLLFYPVQFEGLEESPNIVYLGATANQLAIPGVTWVLENLGKKLYLVGSEHIYQRALYSILKDLIVARNGVVVGEEYLPVNDPNLDRVVQKIIKAKPDAIINMILGEDNRSFFRALRKEGISSEKIPTMSFVVSETELNAYNIDDMIGHYGTQNYFQSLDTRANKDFVQKIFKKMGPNQPISNSMENAYNGVNFWANAVQAAGSTDTDAVRSKLSDRALSTAEGIISIDKKTQHTWKPVLIGKIFPNKHFGIVWNSISTIEPLPYPPFRTKEEWEALLQHWYTTYGNQWWKPEGGHN